MAREKLIIIDFGNPAALIAARLVRGASVYCEILPWNASEKDIRDKAPKGIIAAGGRHDHSAEKKPAFAPYLLELGVPVLALGCASRALLELRGAKILQDVITAEVRDIDFPDISIFEGIDSGPRHIEQATDIELPDGFTAIAEAKGVPLAAQSGDIYALQLIPEQNDMDIARIIENFAANICGCQRDWSVGVFVDEAATAARARTGSGGVIVPLSGGADSAVCAALMHRAIGSRLSCIFIDTGLLRKDEAAKMTALFSDKMGLNVKVSDKSERFIAALAGAHDSKAKREKIAAQMREVIREEAEAIGGIDYIASGVIYRDVIDMGEGAVWPVNDSGPFAGVIEPLRELFKSEVRAAGEILGVPDQVIRRQPFPQAGLAIRVMGEVTREKLAVLREADAIFSAEIEGAGLTKSVWQYFAVLTDWLEAANGGSGIIALRAVNTQGTSNAAIARLPYDLLVRAAAAIMAQVPTIRRVVYDITNKPPAAVEWE